MNTLDKFIIRKTDEQDEIEWVSILSNRNRLLSLSDWTQLADCQLTDENINEWRIWRDKLRSVNRQTFSDKDLALAEIEAIEKIIPLKKIKSFSKDIAQTRQFVIGNLNKKYSEIRLKNLNEYDIIDLQLKIDVCIEYKLDDTPDIGKYQLLDSLYKLHIRHNPDCSIDGFINHIFQINKTLKYNIIKAEDFRLTFYDKLNKCGSVKKLYELDKEINGYRY